MSTDTSPIFPPPPDGADILPSATPNPEVRAFLTRRRSASKHHLRAPGPGAAELDDILRVASRVPDHRKLGPWRYIIFESDARAVFGNKIAEIFKDKNPDATEAQLEEERSRLLRAPVVIGVISSPVDDGRTPVWEQELSAGAVCYNLLLAASASGWASVWLSEWIAFDKDIADAMRLEDSERIAGLIYLGTAELDSPERPRPDVKERTLRWPA